MLATATIALLVAALTLLSPLERKLRDQELRSLVASGVQSRSSFRALEGPDTRHESPALRRIAGRLARETGARIALLDTHRRIVIDTDPDERDRFEDFARALATDRPVRRIVASGAGEARVALRVRVGADRYVLALRKPLDEQRSAVAEVRRAFLTAALTALATAFVLATGFTATVLRRLRRLRDAALRFDVRNPTDDAPHDTHHDEVGDLARAFAEMRERIVHQEAIRQTFVAVASHELRTPLTSLHGQLELLHDDLRADPPDIADARQQLDGARAQTERLARLASDLLDLSRLDAQLGLRSERVELGELARAVAAEFEARSRQRDNPIELSGAEPAWLAGDPGAVARALRILLDNAMRFAPGGTPVRIAIERRGDAIALIVSDQGPGVPQEERERIFERFARGSDSQHGAGFGLGLAIARELAERMNGHLELTTAGPGATAFTLTLPAA